MTRSGQTRDAETQAAAAAGPLDDEALHELLVDSSRTFALAIPLLESGLRREVTIAYLLFRIADTLEDGGARWSRAQRLTALSEFDDLLAAPAVDRAALLTARWLAEPPTDHAGYVRLLTAMPAVIASWSDLTASARHCIATHTRRTVALMSEFVERGDERGFLALASLDELRAYCYAVAGIVGEMLTELFISSDPVLDEAAPDLRQRAAAFGEGLQLVNILKDSDVDESEGRCFIPAAVGRSALFTLARKDLEAAAEYVSAVQRAGGADGVVAFTALPVELAVATLDRVEERGPGAKISRITVFDLYDRVRRAIASGRPAVSGLGAGGGE